MSERFRKTAYSPQAFRELAERMARYSAEYERLAGMLESLRIAELNIPNQESLELGLKNIRAHLGKALTTINEHADSVSLGDSTQRTMTPTEVSQSVTESIARAQAKKAKKQVNPSQSTKKKAL